MTDIFKKKPLPRTLKTVYDDINKAVEDGDGFIPADGTVTNSKLATDVKVGSLEALETTEKSSVQGAINEVVGAIGDLEELIGDGATLDTTEKEEIVGAINELVALIGDLSALGTTEKGSLVGAINEAFGAIGSVEEEIKGEDGSLGDLTTTEQGSIIGAINEIVTRLEAVEGEGEG